jgi:hypothetical protein
MSILHALSPKVPSPPELRPFGDYFFDVPGETLVFEITVAQTNDASVSQTYVFTIDKTKDEENFFTSTEGLVLIVACVALLAGAVGSVYYVNQNAKRKLKSIEEGDFDYHESFDNLSTSVNSPWRKVENTPDVNSTEVVSEATGASEQSEDAPLIQAAEPKATVATNKFCRKCGKPHRAAGEKFCSHCGTPVNC